MNSTAKARSFFILCTAGFAVALADEIYRWTLDLSFLYFPLLGILAWSKHKTKAYTLLLVASAAPIGTALYFSREIDSQIAFTVAARVLAFGASIIALLGLSKTMDREAADADTDSLTGLLNVRGFYQVFENLLDKSRSKKQSLSLINFDLDNFKKLNDTRGHEAGDQLLREIGEKIRSHLRPLDCAVRLGGDEFAVTLPNTSQSDAQSVAERILQSIHDIPLSQENDIGASFGVLAIEHFDLLPRDYVKLADELMYRSKKGGKNQVSCGSHPQ